MKDKESLISEDWFGRADKDLEVAELVLKNKVSLEIAIYHLQQTVEKYLKGYLLSKGWKLKKIHELEQLLNEAMVYEKRFQRFLHLCQVLTEWYVETKYPFRIRTRIKNTETKRYLQKTKKLVIFVKKKVIRKNSKKKGKSNLWKCD